MPFPITEKRLTKFFNLVEKSGNVTLSAAAAKIDRSKIYQRAKVDEAFKKRFEAAKTLGIEALEDEAMRRAFPHDRTKITSKGEVVKFEHPGSDVLTIVMLKGAKPDKYAERSKVDMKNEVTLADIVGNPENDDEPEGTPDS